VAFNASIRVVFGAKYPPATNSSLSRRKWSEEPGIVLIQRRHFTLNGFHPAIIFNSFLIGFGISD
jgi:hypothetical protein